MKVTVDRRAEQKMIESYTADKVRTVMTEAAHAGGMAPPVLGPGDRRIPWPERLKRLEKVIEDYVRGH